MKNSLDHRRKYYLVLDTETATLPFANEYEHKDKIAIAKPLVYDIGWTIVDRNGKIYRKKQYLVAETFSVPSVFNTAYYKEKRPLYTQMITENKITVEMWDNIINELITDLAEVECVGAYNSMFDYKKSIIFTERYIKALSEDYDDFERKQRYACSKIADNEEYDNTDKMDCKNFILRGNKYPMFDIWGLACKHILNSDEYRNFCIENSLYSASGKYYSTNAENCYRFIKKDIDFAESHTALDDVLIESEILSQIINKSKPLDNLEIGIEFFPFRLVGKVEEIQMEGVEI